MIKLINIHKKYGENHILKNLDLKFDETGLVMILGGIGSGKSTLLNLISGIEPVSNGEIIFNENGVPVRRGLKSSFRKKNLSYVTQRNFFFSKLSVIDNIIIPLKLIKRPVTDEVIKLINYYLNYFELEQHQNKVIEELSSGQKQIVSIIRALVMAKKIILLDEVTSNLDDENTKKVLEIVKKISQTTLVIMVNHDERLAYQHANKIIRLKDGVTSQQFNLLEEDIKLVKDEIIPNNKPSVLINRSLRRNLILEQTKRFFKTILIANLILLISIILIYLQQPKSRLDYDHNYYQVTSSSNPSFDDYETIFGIDRMIVPNEKTTLELAYFDNNNLLTNNLLIYYAKTVDPKYLIAGRLPQNNHEVIVTNEVLKSSELNLTKFGIWSNSDIINEKITVGKLETRLIIVGMIEAQYEAIYVTSEVVLFDLKVSDYEARKIIYEKYLQTGLLITKNGSQINHKQLESSWFVITFDNISQSHQNNRLIILMTWGVVFIVIGLTFSMIKLLQRSMLAEMIVLKVLGLSKLEIIIKFLVESLYSNIKSSLISVFIVSFFWKEVFQNLTLLNFELSIFNIILMITILIGFNLIISSFPLVLLLKNRRFSLMKQFDL